MASNSEELNVEERQLTGGLNIEENELSVGHVVYYTVSVANLASLVTGFFRHDFRTTCDVLSTSWKFDLVFHEVTERNELSLSVTLIRDDSNNKKVGVKISVQICNTRDCPIYLPIDFQREEMYPGYRMEETAFRVVPLPLLTILQDEEVVVNVAIKIRSCHSVYD